MLVDDGKHRGSPERYSLLNVLGKAIRVNTGCKPAWRTPTLQRSYDVVVIGDGSHGLATAYFLVKNYGVRRLALLERGHIGQGNSGRNTRVIRSNYFHPVSSSLFDHSLKLYERLGQELEPILNPCVISGSIHSCAQFVHQLWLGDRRL